MPQADHLIDDNEWSFLISGKSLSPVQARDNPAPDWIDTRMWSEVQALSELPAFEGLSESLAVEFLEDFKVISTLDAENRSILKVLSI